VDVGGILHAATSNGRRVVNCYKNPTIFPSGPIALARHLSERDLWLLVPS